MYLWAGPVWVVTRRVFLAGFEAQFATREIPRNKLWRDFVPLVRDSSIRLTALQDYMLAHQKETILGTIDRTFLSNLNGCIDDLEAMVHKLKILKDLVKNGG